MNTETTYNGYKNYETWAVSLWLSNDQGIYEYWREVVECTREGLVEFPENYTNDLVKDPARRLVFVIADMLADAHEEAAVEHIEQGNIFADLLNAALSSVDWVEIAESIIAE